MDDRLFCALDILAAGVSVVVGVPGMLMAIWGFLALFIPPLRDPFLSLADAMAQWLLEW